MIYLNGLETNKKKPKHFYNMLWHNIVVYDFRNLQNQITIPQQRPSGENLKTAVL